MSAKLEGAERTIRKGKVPTEFQGVSVVEKVLKGPNGQPYTKQGGVCHCRENLLHTLSLQREAD